MCNLVKWTYWFWRSWKMFSGTALSSISQYFQCTGFIESSLKMMSGDFTLRWIFVVLSFTLWAIDNTCYWRSYILTTNFLFMLFLKFHRCLIRKMYKFANHCFEAFKTPHTGDARRSECVNAKKKKTFCKCFSKGKMYEMQLTDHHFQALFCFYVLLLLFIVQMHD